MIQQKQPYCFLKAVDGGVNFKVIFFAK